MKFNSIIFVFIACVFAQDAVVQVADKSAELSNPDHISLLIHEDLLNEFFSNMGVIKGGGKNYEWKLKKPRIEISKNKAVFKAKIQVVSGILSSTQDVLGKVDVSYDKDENLIIVKIVKADVIIDIGGYDIGKINIGKYFSKPLKLNGPQAVSEHIEFTLPSGDIRTIDITVLSYTLDLIEGAIKVSTSLGFEVLDTKK